MEGTLQIIVNLRSRSVEFSREQGDDRFSCVLAGDVMSAEDIVALPGFTDMPFATDMDKLLFITNELIKKARDFKNLDYLSITRRGQDVTVHPDDISYITFIKKGVFENL